MKKKINNPRFLVTVELKPEHFPNLDKNILLMNNQPFYTLRDIAEELNLTYPCVNNIFKRKTLKHNKNKTWFDSPMSPCITINRVEEAY